MTINELHQGRRVDHWFNNSVKDAVEGDTFLLIVVGFLLHYSYHADQKKETKQRCLAGQLDLFEENPEM
jgi:hypothetical protein